LGSTKSKTRPSNDYIRHLPRQKCIGIFRKPAKKRSSHVFDHLQPKLPIGIRRSVLYQRRWTSRTREIGVPRRHFEKSKLRRLSIGDPINRKLWESYFHEGDYTKAFFYLDKHPPFMCIDYWVIRAGLKPTPPVATSSLQTFKFGAPKTRIKDGTRVSARQVSNFRLCTVVERGAEQRVRLYHNNGNEIVPAQVGDFRTKEPEALEEPWSVEEEGRLLSVLLQGHGAAGFSWPSK
jgi:hypothetical protein